MMSVICFHYLSQNQIILSSNIKVFHKSLDFSVTNQTFNYAGVHGLILIDSWPNQNILIVATPVTYID